MTATTIPGSTPSRGGVLPPCGNRPCTHLDVFHDLNAKGERTKCLTATGHTGAPCECKVYLPEGGE